MAEKNITLLDKLEEMLDIDLDYMETDYLKSMPIKPHDETSNQSFVDLQLAQPSSKPIIEQAARELKDAGWLAIYSRAAVLLCKRNVDLISGRVLLQTSPSDAYDLEKTLAHARLYDQEFARVGITRDRYCIKIPCTGPALNAGKILAAEGIPTLGTALFGLPQAVASSQAGCIYVSPYLNEIPAHQDKSVWPNVDDPALQHPMSPRVLQILETYKQLYKETGKEQPAMKLASFISVKEALAAGEFGCQSATLFHETIDELAAQAYSPESLLFAAVPKRSHPYKDAPPVPARLRGLLAIDPLNPSGKVDAVQARTDVDYLANNGAALAAAIEADPAVSKRLKDALDHFIREENSSKAKIDAALKAL